MTDQTKAATRDEVLFAFHRDCASPTLDQIIDWTQRYPEYADDIRAHATIIREWNAENALEEEDVEELMMNRAKSRALNAIYNAQVAEHSQTRASDDITFAQLLATAGLTTPQLSRSIDLGRDVLSDLFRGRMRRPIGSRLVEVLLQKLQASIEDFEQALTNALAKPSLGHARADKQPTVIQRSYEEIIRSSNMPPERKAYWLEEN